MYLAFSTTSAFWRISTAWLLYVSFFHWPYSLYLINKKKIEVGMGLVLKKRKTIYIYIHKKY